MPPSRVELVALTLATVTFHSVGQLAALDQADALPSTLPLPDVMHSLIDDCYRKEWHVFSERLVSAALGYLGIGCLLTKSSAPAERFILLANVAFIMRSLCMASTVLPDASQCCTVNIPFSVKGGFKSGSCHDLLFSGHMTMTTLASLIAAQSLGAPLVTKSIAACIITSQLIAITASRNHYTVDVLVALIVCKLLTMVHK